MTTVTVDTNAAGEPVALNVHLNLPTPSDEQKVQLRAFFLAIANSPYDHTIMEVVNQHAEAMHWHEGLSQAEKDGIAVWMANDMSMEECEAVNEKMGFLKAVIQMARKIRAELKK